VSNSDHVGRFIVLDEDIEGENALRTALMMRLFNVHEKERIHFPPGIEYVASCPLFRKRKIGELVPRYLISIRDEAVVVREITDD
jgi:hypothetical protein